ncbi:hypothetical protein [Bacillus sp. FJAT-28004]|uniref:hypothetical protein n=1 Tax=Bacillus sp. FJAT-28004 TaxID=1679165 RepID=UPI0006B65BD7|nr:hypothetical protein [Bacillus sp. FJAT-28004]
MFKLLEKGSLFLREYKTFQMLALVTFLSIVGASSVYATPAKPTIVSGGILLINAASGWLLLIIPVSSAAIFGFHAWAKSVAEEGGEVADRNKKMKRVIIWGSVAMSGSAIIKLIFFYLANQPVT